MPRHAIILLLASTLLCGCGLMPKPGPTAQAGGGAVGGREVNSGGVRLTYRTSSDRLNLAGGGVAPALPAATESVLQVDYPHPAGKPGVARVLLHVRPEAEPAGWFGAFTGNQPAPPESLEVRVYEVPADEVQRIVAKLRSERFFQRYGTLNTEAFVGVETAEDRVAKEYRSVPELDALALRARSQGYVLGAGPSAAGLAHAPAVNHAAPAAGIYPTTGAPSPEFHTARGRRRLPPAETDFR